MSYLSPSEPCQIFHLQLKHFFLLPFFIAGNFICLPSTVFVQRRGGDMTDLSQEKNHNNQRRKLENKSTVGMMTSSHATAFKSKTKQELKTRNIYLNFGKIEIKTY